MNKELKILNNKAIVIDENNNKKELTLTNNLEDILIAENNLEYIKKELEKINIKCEQLKNNNKLIKIITMIALISIFAFCSILGTINIIALCSIPFLLTTTLGVSVLFLNTNKKHKNNLKSKEELLKTSYSEESKKIKELIKNSKKINIQKQKIKNIETSDYLKKLKRKLHIINNFQKKKKIYKHLYNNFVIGEVLFQKGYSSEEINLIVSLIQNETEKNEENNKTLIKK